ncbi:MFS transporter [Novosphingobium mangrovi (ex Huang et al. 2023)]|uniref:MFS transporter n=1 Tax=Novosphingobium mangrovi (ex Huang et al. 2023) TaxID=2976432 RepID=A0ABT2I7L1_9SPHN|nr:MFS transporter [Novosphingobium mangrovi (ex Huang et al. 2023)]MCT2400796.1 MFS transporter [Novosphingobium mangrovi (ex Huang et al. 2023)]
MAGNGQVDQEETAGGAFAPLREPVFCRIWSASLFSNFGQLFLGVGAAWEMTRLSSSPSMVALVQTAMMVPLMLVTLPAGAIADMFDRRRIAMSGLGFSAVCAAILAGISHFDLVTPWLLLAFCVMIGAGVAFYSPSWQASIPEQVSRAHLPAAVALGTISYNVARSFGPALGGLIVVLYGARSVFGMTSLLYLPLMVAFFLWRREHVPSRLPPERIDRAMIGGARYALHAPAIRTALLRVLCFGLTTATASALAPLIAKDLLHGNAATFGILLGAQGVGAVSGALFVSAIRERISTEMAVRIFAVGSGIALVGIGFSHSLILTCAAFLVVGACNILTVAMLNVTVQLSAPRWVTARALSLFSSAITAGIGIGAWGWGVVAGEYSVAFAVIASGIAVSATALLGFVLPLASDQILDNDSVELGHEPEVELALTMRSGPIVVEVDYDVDPDRARDFYGAMMKMQGMRKRIGAFQWSIARDIANPALWTERYHCPTWGDYLRMRDRYTQADFVIQAEVDAFNRSGHARRVRRRLERPFGSVRWKADSYDPHQETIGFIGP